MKQKFTIIIEKGEDGYLLSEVLGLPGCHTQAKTKKDLIERTKKAIALYMKCQKDSVKITETFVGVQKIAV